jgi:hypothetical protein
MLAMNAEELIFIDWKSDVGFKWLFAREAVSGHLVAFLRDLGKEVDGNVKINLPEESAEQEVELEYLNVEVVTREEVDSIRKILFDVYVKLPDGNRVIMEMQKAPHKDLDLRMIKYLIRGIESSGGISHVLVALMNFKFSEILGTSTEGAVVKVHEVVKKGVFVTVELGRFDKCLEELETGLDCWLFLFKNITKLKSVPEVFRGTIFEKIMEMSRIKTLPKEQKEDWKKELDNNKYVQEGIQILAEQAAVEMAEKMAEKMAIEMAEKMAIEMAKQMVEKVKAEVKAEAAEATINAYKKGEEDGAQKGELMQLKLNIAKMRSKGMSEAEIKAILDLEELPELE